MYASIIYNQVIVNWVSFRKNKLFNIKKTDYTKENND